MYVGHAAIALALKAREPRIPVAVLVLASFGPDWTEIALGFAFGGGYDRLAMIRFGIPDIRILWENDGITQRELSTEAGVMEPTTHVALNAMETMGYILRKRRPENRRNVYVHLTPRGRALKAKLVPLAEDVNAIGVAGLPAADIGTVRRALIAIIDNLARDEALAEVAATVENVARPNRSPRTRVR